jgi:hypothetical protein
MAEPSGKLRAVGDDEAPPQRRRGPGIAVLLVLFYALAFAAALWLLWTYTRRERGPSRAPEPRAAAPLTDRKAIAAGEGVKPSSRAAYRRELSRNRCDCGCGRTLQECLTVDQKCTRSPELAERLRRGLD